MSDESYIDYFAVLGLEEECKPGEVRKSYKKRMKDLVLEISRVQITQDRRDNYLLDLARHNAAFYILRDAQRREEYVSSRARVMALEEEWRAAAEIFEKSDGDTEAESKADQLRRRFDSELRHFLSTYMEELMLEAGRDRECVEASHWDLAHERHAGRVLRLYRQRLYHEIHERLPFYDVTRPEIDWDERSKAVAALLAD